MHIHTPGTFSDHDVVLDPGSLAAEAAGAERALGPLPSPSGDRSPRRGPDVTGRADPGDVLEAIELSGEGWVLGILWHTEEEASSRVMRAFCAAATPAGVGA